MWSKVLPFSTISLPKSPHPLSPDSPSDSFNPSKTTIPPTNLPNPSPPQAIFCHFSPTLHKSTVGLLPSLRNVKRMQVMRGMRNLSFQVVVIAPKRVLRHTTTRTQKNEARLYTDRSFALPWLRRASGSPPPPPPLCKCNKHVIVHCLITVNVAVIKFHCLLQPCFIANGLCCAVPF